MRTELSDLKLEYWSCSTHDGWKANFSIGDQKYQIGDCWPKKEKKWK